MRLPTMDGIFQKGISLNAFLSLYGTEDQCFDALYGDGPMGFCARTAMTGCQ